jgi:hypothetical protein
MKPTYYELEAENKKLRRHVRYLKLSIQEEVGRLSYEERDELDELSPEFLTDTLGEC